MPRRVRRKKRSKRKPAAPHPPPAVAPQPCEPAAKPGRFYRNAKALMKAIFTQNDAVEIASDLLKKSSDSTRAKVFLQCLEYQYGKPVQPIEAREPADEELPFKLITHVPRPQYPARTANAADSSGASLPANTHGGRAEAPRKTEENNHG